MEITFSKRLDSLQEFWSICVKPNAEAFFKAEEKLMEISTKQKQGTEELEKEVLCLAWNATVSLHQFFDWHWHLYERIDKNERFSNYVTERLSSLFIEHCRKLEPNNEFNGQEMILLMDIANSYKHYGITRNDRKIDSVYSIGIKQNNSDALLPWEEFLPFNPVHTLQTVVIEKAKTIINDKETITGRSLYVILKRVLAYSETLL